MKTVFLNQKKSIVSKLSYLGPVLRRFISGYLAKNSWLNSQKIFWLNSQIFLAV